MKENAMSDYAGMTVNERLFAANLTAEYEAAVASGDLNRMNGILGKVGLKRDASGMHHSIKNGPVDAQNR